MDKKNNVADFQLGINIQRAIMVCLVVFIASIFLLLLNQEQKEPDYAAERQQFINETEK